MLFKIYPILKDYDERIFQQAIQTLTLFGWAHFGEHDSVQPQPKDGKQVRNINEQLINFITQKYGKGLYGTTTNATPDEERWAAILKAYDFGSPDALDALFYEGLRNGYFDERKIVEQAKILTSAFAQGAARNAWNKAWDVFHNSFDDNRSEVVKALRDSFIGIVARTSAGELNVVMKVFKQLGEDKLAREMLDLFMKEREERPDFYELEQDPFNQIDDADLRKEFAEKAVILRETPAPHEILLRIYKDRVWSPSDTRVLSELSVEDYYKMFKMPLGDDHRRVIAAALSFRQIGNPEYASIVDKSVEALKRIGKENDLNRIRVRGYGVNVDDAN